MPCRALKGPAAGTSLAATIGASSATAAGTGPALDAIVPPPRPTFHIDPQRCISAIPPLKRAVAAHCEASIGSTLSSSVATGGGGGDDGGQGGAGRHGGGGIRSPCLHVKGSRSLFSIYEWAGGGPGLLRVVVAWLLAHGWRDHQQHPDGRSFHEILHRYHCRHIRRPGVRGCPWSGLWHRYRRPRFAGSAPTAGAARARADADGCAERKVKRNLR